MPALVTGATGFVGRRLLRQLDRPHVLSRDPQRAERALAEFGVRGFAWDPAAGEPPAAAFEGVDAIFHLAGEPLAEGRWTVAKKQRIRDSRVLGTQRLVDLLGRLGQRPRVLVAASAVGYYGDRGDDVLDESALARPRFPGHAVRRLGSRGAAGPGGRHPRRQRRASGSCWAGMAGPWPGS